MGQKQIIAFVCEHGAAKSILAAAYFNKLAAEKGLEVRAIARGTHPDEELSQKTIDGLRQDGLLPSETAPKRLLLSEVQGADKVIAFCELPEKYREKVTVERWDKVSPVSEDYATARDVIVENIKLLLENIE